jgi:hypothetical protein
MPDMPDASLPPLSQLDAELAQLRAENPGWRVWYVPHGVDGSVTWCAQPLPLLNCGSPKELSEEIAEACGSVPTLSRADGVG